MFAGLDTRYLELSGGIGLGMWSKTAEPVGMLIARARFGARDGLNLHVLAGALYDPLDNHDFFTSGRLMVRVGMQIPVSSRWAFTLDGGGSQTRDTAEVMLGGRHRLVGDIGDRAGLWLAASAGVFYSELQIRNNTGAYFANDLTYIGPAVKGTLDFRL